MTTEKGPKLYLQVSLKKCVIKWKWEPKDKTQEKKKNIGANNKALLYFN